MKTSTAATRPRKADPEVLLSAKFSVRWECDDNPDTSHWGEYTDQWKEGAIDRVKLGDTDGLASFKYFVSTNHAVHNPKNWEHVNGKDKQKVIQEFGSLKNADRHYAREDYRRMEEFNRGEWRYEGCVVTVRIGNLEAEDSLWGVESDAGEEYREGIEHEVKAQALARLKEKIMKRLEVE